MATHSQNDSAPEHLATMIARGEVRPSEGLRFLPRPIKTQPTDKTAADWVAEGRR